MGQDLPLGARLLKPVLDLVAGESAGLSLEESFARLKSQPQHYDPEVMKVMAGIVGENKNIVIKEIPIAQLKENMQIAADVATFSGALLVAKGQEVGPSLVARLNNFCINGEINDKVYVYICETS